MSRRLRFGIVGYGALGQALTSHLAQHEELAEIVGYVVRDVSRFNGDGRFVAELDELLARKPDVVIECAGQQAMRQHALSIVRAGVDLVPASVGALVDDAWRRELLAAAHASGARIRIPTGAIVGIDGLAAARHVGIDSVVYRGTMPPSTLKAHYDGVLPEHGLVFEGTAREAVRLFPKNVNLAGTIALAGVGFEQTRVEMHVDPALTANVHELFVRGAFGEFHVRISGLRLSESSPSSRIVAGSLAQSALGSNFTVLQR
ncbi:aspartate dehydrogenase [Paracandidimonas soli]|uniref:L-aspartate dehydrogenase n=1 Tax=Paracandidimonas soli TaxID=1917182 RepID=A0A4R3UY99_9BURK|nr:aspartate dehydrogenase [Paracandidimonas soli]TCU96061.1 aspartate dehydrogenase [Paracandidimonas soli]